MSEVVFCARGLAKRYVVGEVTIHALRGVDLDLCAGEFVVLLGPSGSGKSTLLNILGGLDVPSAGHVRYGGVDLTRADEAALTAFRREHVGFVFQFYNLIPSLTARENVEVVTDIAQQQRVAIARAIAKRPSVLLCDEPTGALDSDTGVVVLEALAAANRELGTLTVVITHNAAIAGMADRVIHLHDGRIGGETRNATRLAPRDVHW